MGCRAMSKFIVVFVFDDVLTAIFPGKPGYPVMLELRMMEVAVTLEL